MSYHCSNSDSLQNKIFSIKADKDTFVGAYLHKVNGEWMQRRYHYSYNSIKTLHATYANEIYLYSWTYRFCITHYLLITREILEV